MISNTLTDINSVLQFLTLLTLITAILSSKFGNILIPRMEMSKLSGNTVKITHQGGNQSLLKFDISTGKSIRLTLYLNFHFNFLEFDTKLIKFGDIRGLELHKEVYCSLGKIQ